MNGELESISPSALNERMRGGEPVALLDVRTPAEFDARHVRGAHLLPLDELSPDRAIARLGGNGLGKEQPLYVTCQSGLRAAQAARRLAEAGYPRVTVLEGGVQAWAQAGLPVVTGKARSTLSLERQVQIALGVLVLLKVGFGFAVHPAFFVLLAALGVGLVVAGITENCALARLIARMPWNRRPLGDAGAHA